MCVASGGGGEEEEEYSNRGEWGKLSHSPQLWSYSKDLLHHACCTKTTPCGRKVSRNFFFIALLVKKIISFFHLMHNNIVYNYYGCYCDSPKYDI